MASSFDIHDQEDEASARSDSPASSSSASSAASSSAVSLGKSGLQQEDDCKSLVTPAPGNVPYVETSPQPSPRVGDFNHADIINAATVRDLREREEAQRPSIIISSIPTPPHQGVGSPLSMSTASPSPLTPESRYPGWVNEVVEPLRPYIDAKADPRDLFADLHEIAEGESGSVYAARIVAPSSMEAAFVAIKQVTLVPSGSAKLDDLQRELSLMKQVRHANILRMEAVYVDLLEDSLWIRMELMDRSLADVLNLAEEGIALSEGHIAQFAADVSSNVHR